MQRIVQEEKELQSYNPIPPPFIISKHIIAQHHKESDWSDK